MDTRDVVAALAALAQESRLAVYRLLVKRGPGGFAAGEISAQLGIPGPTLSFHLKELSQAGLVTARKEARHIYYAANFERMSTLLAFLTENCCGLGIECAPACEPNRARKPGRRTA